jgi:hypothetical protein
VLNTATDFYLIWIPIPMLWHTSLSLFKKFGLIFVFSTGVIANIFGFLRCSILLNVSSTSQVEMSNYSAMSSY